MISFYHPKLNKGKPLITRLSPKSIDWTYNLNTNIINTYGGQVVQLLGINYDTLTIRGMFGKEGPHGRTKRSTEPNNFWDYANIDGNPYSIGLTQLTAFFQDYFTVASQGPNEGSGTRLTGNYDQVPMVVSYTGSISSDEGNLDTLVTDNTHTGIWSVYPTSFPSYSRGLDQFAPQFTIMFEVEEANNHADVISTLKSIEHIKKGIGYDPTGISLNPITSAAASFDLYTIDDINDKFASWLPHLDINNINNVALSHVIADNVVQSAGYKIGQIFDQFTGLF